MKAIVNVNPESSYSKYNKLTFEVAELFPGKPGTSIICLNINNTRVDFTQSEVLIVDIESEVRNCLLNLKAAKQTKETSTIEYLEKKFSCLRNYCISNGW